MQPWRSLRLRFFSIAFPIAVAAFVSVVGAALYLINHSFQRIDQELARRQQTLSLTTEFA